VEAAAQPPSPPEAAAQLPSPPEAAAQPPSPPEAAAQPPSPPEAAASTMAMEEACLAVVYVVAWQRMQCRSEDDQGRWRIWRVVWLLGGRIG
jgi:hypothetical protein